MCAVAVTLLAKLVNLLVNLRSLLTRVPSKH